MMIVRIPVDKQRDICQHITRVLSSTHQQASSLQSLAGKLNFIAKAFPLGRPFIRHLYDLAAGKHPKQMIEIDNILLQDLHLWDQVLRNFKGWLPILDLNQRKQASVTIYTDALAESQLGLGHLCAQPQMVVIW